MENVTAQRPRSAPLHGLAAAARANAWLIGGYLAIGLLAADVQSRLAMPMGLRIVYLTFLAATVLGLAVWTLSLASGAHLERHTTDALSLTDGVLAEPRYDREGWILVRDLDLGGRGEVERVRVGPGGAYAITSTWTDDPRAVVDLGLTGPADREPVAFARHAAAMVEAKLRENFAVSVQPVLILWGPGAPHLYGGWTAVDGVLILEGRRRWAWQDCFDRDDLDADRVRSISRVLHSQAGRPARAGDTPLHVVTG